MPSSDHRLVILLGAGASKAACMPLLDELTRDVRSMLAASEPHLSDAFDRAASRATRVGIEGGEVTVEDVLALLDAALISRQDVAGLSRYTTAALEYSVRRWIWERLSVPGSLSALSALTRLLQRDGGIDVFTVNNDLVIEHFCDTHHIPLCVGFQPSGDWDPGMFEQAESACRLYKLHGSVDWQYRPGFPLRSRTGPGVRKPDGTRVARSPLADIALVFPSQNKVVSAIPLLELLLKFHTLLRTAELLVVVGYRMADPHVFGAVQDALRSNATLRVLIVDPSPYDLMDRLAPWKPPPGFAQRIDFMPERFDAALSGPLFDAIAQSTGGECSVQQQLRHALRNVPAPEALQLCDVVADRLECLAEREYAYVRDTVCALIPLPAPDGPRADLHRKILAATAKDRTQSTLGLVLRSVRSATAGKCFDSCIGVAASAGRTFVISGARLLEVLPDWQCTRRNRRALSDAYGLAIRDGIAYFAERRTLGIEGLGTLRALELATGATRRVLPASLTSLAAAGGGLRLGARAFVEAAGARHLKRELLALGFLNYPTSVRVLDRDRIVVVEADRVVILRTATQQIEHSLPRQYRNLADCWCIDGNRILILEGGMSGEGRLLLWNIGEENPATVTGDVAGVAGIAVDTTRNVLLMTTGGEMPRGKVIRCDLTPDGRVGPAKVVIEGLHVPRYMCQLNDNEWIVTTVHGPVQFSL